ncbi:MAG: DUF4435 domain-containing protein [bacterium]|nr:DUF4435 domain-containing protein [bacterium]
MDTLYLAKDPNQPVEIEVNDCVVIVGSNGAGKTRLGCWVDIDSPQSERVHRISAQRDLDFPQEVMITNPEAAQKELLIGSQKPKKKKLNEAKAKHRWGANPATSFLFDFYEVMTYLLSDHAAVSAEYLKESRKKKGKVRPPISKLDTLLQIWKEVLPGKELLLENLTINTCLNLSDNLAYDSSQMSDGERVIFYLIGQCLSAPKNGIIILDEPENHLHKSLQVTLWQTLRAVRSDCLFVFLTHDIEFAAAQTSAVKIWLKSYNGTQWDWEIIEPDQSIPEALLLKLLGTKRPILFVEGVEESLDAAIYRLFYPNKLIVPVESCQKVIEYTKSVRAETFEHRFEATGLVDRDRRTDAEINSLQESGVFVLPVAEVENLYCVPEVVILMAHKFSLDADQTLQKVVTAIFERFIKETDTQIALRLHQEIKFLVAGQKESTAPAQTIIEIYQKALLNSDITQLSEDIKRLFERIVEESNYLKLLKYYNRKKLIDTVGSCLGLRNGEYSKSFLRFYKQDGDSFSQALKGYLPTIS